MYHILIDICHILKQKCNQDYQIHFFQPSKREHLQSLSEEFGFEIWETYCEDDFAGGLLVFKTFLDAYTFCRRGIQCSYLDFKNSWYESYKGGIASNILKNIIAKLNEDCINEISERLDVVSFADLFGVHNSSRLIHIASRKFSNLIINQSTVGNKLGLMNLCYVLHKLNDIVTNITISTQSFRGGMRKKGNRKLKYSILHCIWKFAGSKLNSLTLQSFEIQNNDSKFQTLINMLQQKNIALRME